MRCTAPKFSSELIKGFVHQFRFAILFLILALLLSNCAHTYYLYPTLLYCKYDYNVDQLAERYKTTPIYRGKHLKTFVQRLEKVDHPSKSKRAPKNDASVFQVFVDEQGQIESIFLFYRPQPNPNDSLALQALKRSQFKPLKRGNGQPTKYSVFVVYPFIEGQPFGPYVNGIPVYKTKKNLAPIPHGHDGVYYIYEVSEPPILLQAERLTLELPVKKPYSSYLYLRFEYELTIDETGKVITIKEIFTTHPQISEQIKANIRKRKYKPAILDGNPVKAQLFETITIHRKIERMPRIPRFNPFSREMMER